MSSHTVDPETLTLQLTDMLDAEGSHVRQVLHDEIETRLPRDTETRINVQLSELNPGRTATWHAHNGIVYFVIVRGLVSLQYEGRIKHYSAGDVYTEPIGVVHRALNPHPSIPASLIGFWVTASDRPHVTETGPPDWTPVEEAHPGL